MKVKVLKAKKIIKKRKFEPKILTPNYVSQLNEKISYNIIEAENRRDLGKKELTLRKSKF